ncbi:sensor histidine kinase [Novosphingopyxis iocasae]|uniref:sensor histidine kinase n=1 Tax=Novosphingopyxis iocasae TaxID=2762729 RepID=UPI00165185DB|nr:HAMP domain-containing sensor histidine kinase [Novosphingopyxis iocasae]
MRSLALHEPICGTCGPDGELLSADLPLRRLQLRAGGDDGGTIALPGLLALCREAARLGMKLARRIEASDADNDYRFLVETAPGDDGNVDFCILSWSEAARDQRPDAAPRFTLSPANHEVGFQLDSGLNLISCDLGAVEELPSPEIGSALTDWLTLLPDEASRMPMLAAVAERQTFRGQGAKIADRNAQLSGHPMLAARGEFAGYVCTLELLAAEAKDEEPPSLAPFPAQLVGPKLQRPLDRIVANAETIHAQIEGPIRANYAGYARDIASAASHLKGLVGDFGDLEAVENAQFALDCERIDCSELARRAAGLLSVRAADHNITIQAPSESDSLQATGEYRRVLQILVNLIGNAVRYAPDGTQVTVETETSENDEPCIVVADQGSGLTDEQRTKVFEKFERLGRSGDGGSGLGLYISRRLARAMGGDLRAVEADEGARFVLNLPPA